MLSRLPKLLRPTVDLTESTNIYLSDTRVLFTHYYIFFCIYIYTQRRNNGLVTRRRTEVHNHCILYQQQEHCGIGYIAAVVALENRDKHSNNTMLSVRDMDRLLRHRPQVDGGRDEKQALPLLCPTDATHGRYHHQQQRKLRRTALFTLTVVLLVSVGTCGNLRNLELMRTISHPVVDPATRSSSSTTTTTTNNENKNYNNKNHDKMESICMFAEIDLQNMHHFTPRYKQAVLTVAKGVALESLRRQCPIKRPSSTDGDDDVCESLAFYDILVKVYEKKNQTDSLLLSDSQDDEWVCAFSHLLTTTTTNNKNHSTTIAAAHIDNNQYHHNNNNNVVNDDQTGRRIRILTRPETYDKYKQNRIDATQCTWIATIRLDADDLLGPGYVAFVAQQIQTQLAVSTATMMTTTTTTATTTSHDRNNNNNKNNKDGSNSSFSSSSYSSPWLGAMMVATQLPYLILAMDRCYLGETKHYKNGWSIGQTHIYRRDVYEQIKYNGIFDPQPHHKAFAIMRQKIQKIMIPKKKKSKPSSLSSSSATSNNKKRKRRQYEQQEESFVPIKFMDAKSLGFTSTVGVWRLTSLSSHFPWRKVIEDGILRPCSSTRQQQDLLQKMKLLDNNDAEFGDLVFHVTNVTDAVTAGDACRSNTYFKTMQKKNNCEDAEQRWKLNFPPVPRPPHPLTAY